MPHYSQVMTGMSPARSLCIYVIMQTMHTAVQTAGLRRGPGAAGTQGPGSPGPGWERRQGCVEPVGGKPQGLQKGWVSLTNRSPCPHRLQQSRPTEAVCLSKPASFSSSCQETSLPCRDTRTEISVSRPMEKSCFCWEFFLKIL